MAHMTGDRSAHADAVRLERHRRRLKQTDVAELAGLDQATISKAENGGASESTYAAIAAALGLDLVEAP